MFRSGPYLLSSGASCLAVPCTVDLLVRPRSSCVHVSASGVNIAVTR